MKSQMSRSEEELRKRFDFSKAVRGKYHDRYKNGYRVHFLTEDPCDEDPLDSAGAPGLDLSTREMGKRFFESQLRMAGLGWEEPDRAEDFDYLVFPHAGNGARLAPYEVQLKTSANETFSLHKTDVHSPRSVIAYVWRAQSPQDSVIYALSYDEAFRIIQTKRYVNTRSWKELGGYSVTHAGSELKQMLAPFRMSPESWQQKLKMAG
jgi:hypothetical protein